MYISKRRVAMVVALCFFIMAYVLIKNAMYL